MTQLSPAEQTQQFERIARQQDRVEKAKEAVKRQQAVLDLIVAELVSAKPESKTWYLHPGPMTPDQVQGAAGLTELGLDKTMERYRGARKAKATKRKGRR